MGKKRVGIVGAVCIAAIAYMGGINEGESPGSNSKKLQQLRQGGNNLLEHGTAEVQDLRTISQPVFQQVGGLVGGVADPAQQQQGGGGLPIQPKAGGQ